VLALLLADFQPHGVRSSVARGGQAPAADVPSGARRASLRRRGQPPSVLTSARSRSSTKGGALAGLSVDLLFFPIDTLKTRLQSQAGFIQAGGFSGVYKGIGSVFVGGAPGGASRHAHNRALGRC